MDLHERNWTPCIVFGASGHFRFGCPLKAGISVLILPMHNVEIGDFIDIKYKAQADPNPNNRAQHVATDVRKSEQPAPRIRVLNDKVIFFYTCAQVRDFDKFQNKRVTMLHNNIFGYIIDLDQKLPLLQVGTIVEVECRLKESPKQRKNTIFIVTDYNKENKNPKMPEQVVLSGNTIPLNAQKTIQPEASAVEKPRNFPSHSREEASLIPRLCDISLSPMSFSGQQQAVREQDVHREPSVSSQKAEPPKTTNKYAGVREQDVHREPKISFVHSFIKISHVHTPKRLYLANSREYVYTQWQIAQTDEVLQRYQHKCRVNCECYRSTIRKDVPKPVFPGSDKNFHINN